MNEQALNYSYELFKQDGYTGTLDQYKQLISSDKKALDYSYSLFKNDGYSGSVDDFSGLISPMAERPVAQAPVAEVKKNRSSVSPFVDGGSELTKFDPRTGQVVQETPSFTQPSVRPQAPQQPKPTETIMYGPMGAVGLQRTKEYKPEYEGKSLPKVVGELGKTFAKGVVKFPADVLETAAIATTAARNLAAKTGLVDESTAAQLGVQIGGANVNFFQAASEWKNLVNDFIPTDKDIESGFWGQTATALGQMVPVILTGGMSGGGRAIAKEAGKKGLSMQAVANYGKDIVSRMGSAQGVLTVSQVAAPSYQQAKLEGATENEAIGFALQNAVMTLPLEMMPVNNLFKRLDNVLVGNKGVEVLKRALVGGAEEGITEGIQNIYENVTADAIYGTTREFLDGVGESTAVGGTVGAIMNGLLTALLGRRAKATSQMEIEQLDKSIEEVQQKVDQVESNNNAIKKTITEIEETRPRTLSYGSADYNFLESKNGDLEYADDALTEEQAQGVVNNLASSYKKIDFTIEAVEPESPYQPTTYKIIGKPKTIQQDAIQEQAAGEVPVQSGAGVSQEVAERVSQAEPQGVTQEGKEKVKPAISEMAGESVTVRIGNRNVSGIVEVDEGGKATITEGSVTYEIPSDSQFSEFSRPVNVTKDGDFVVNGDSFNEARIVLEDGKKKALLVRQDGTTKAVTNPRVVEEIEYNIALASLEEMNDADADNLINQYEQQRKTEKPTEGAADKTASESDEDRRLREAFEEIDLIEEMALMELEDVESQAKLVEHTPKTMKEAKTYLVKKNPDGTYQATLNGRKVARKEVLDDLGKLFEQRASEDISKLQDQTNKLKQEVEEKLFGKEKAKAEPKAEEEVVPQTAKSPAEAIKEEPAPKKPRPVSKKKNRQEIISRPAVTSNTLARQWLLSGGKLRSTQSEEDKMRGVGVGKGVRDETGMSGVEMRGLTGTINNKRGVSIEVAAEKIYGGLNAGLQEKISEQDIRNALIDILKSENKKTWIENQDRETSEDGNRGTSEYYGYDQNEYDRLTDEERADFDAYYFPIDPEEQYFRENAERLSQEYDEFINSEEYQNYIEEIYGPDREGQADVKNQGDTGSKKQGSDGGTISVQEKERPQAEVEFNEDEVNLLSNLLDKSEAEGKDLPEVFQLETTTDNEARKQSLVESATKLMETVSDDLSSKSSQTNAPTMEPTPIVITENTELTNKVPRFPLVDLIKKRINLVMADQLKVGDGFMGGPLFPLIEGIFGKAAWASINLDAARKIVRGAINGDYSVVFNMNPTAVDSNTAFMDTFIKKLNDAGIKENVLVELKSYVKDKKFGKKTDQIRKITEESTTIDEFSEKLSELDVDTISDFVKKIIPSKSVVAETAIGKILQSQNITQEDIRDEISEQLAKDLPMGAMTMVLKITDANGNPVTEKNIDDAIITPEQQKAEGIPSHRNYPFYVRGSAVGILDSTVPFWNMSKAAMSTINAKVAKVIRNSEGKAYSASQARAAAMRSASMKASKSFVTQPPTKSAYQQFIERLSKAIPSVEVVTSQKEFDDLLTNLNAKSLATKNQKIYGAVLDGKLYLNPSLENFNTPIHEFAHVWTNTIKELSPEIYKKGIDLIKGSDYVSQIEASKDYKRITDKMRKDGATDQEIRDYILEEALATAVGDKGESFATASQQRNFKNWLNDLFQFIKKLTGISKLTPEQIQDLNLDDFLNSVVVDLLSEKPIFKNAEVKNLNNQLQLMARPGLKADDIVKIGLANGFSKGSIRELLKRRGFTQGAIDIALGKTTPTDKKAPSAEKIVGKPERNKVTVDEMAALKDQIRLEARAAREAKGDLNKKRKALAAKASALKGKGTVTTNQIDTIVKRIESTNLDNPIMVDRLLAYIEKVFDNSNYAADMAELRKLQKQARSRNHTSMTNVVNQFTSINPETIPLDRIQDYKKALDFLNNLTPSYATMNEMLDEMLSYQISEEFDAIKTKEALEKKYKDIMANEVKTVEDYVNLIKDINSFKRKAFQLLQNEEITQGQYDELIQMVGKDQAAIEEDYKDEITKIKKDLIAEIKNQRPKVSRDFSNVENDLIRKYLELSDADLESLSPEDLFVLNDLLENISNGEIDNFRFNEIISKAYTSDGANRLAKQIDDSKFDMTPEEGTKELSEYESSFWEGLLGMGRAKSGALQKFVVSVFNRAIASYENLTRDGYNKFLKIKDEYKMSDKDMHKIGMLTTYLQEYMAQFDPKNEGIKDIGNRDWFKEILNSKSMRGKYSSGKPSILKVVGLGKSEIDIIEEIWNSLPKDSNGNVNPKAVYDSYMANDGKFFTKNQKGFFDDIMDYKSSEITPKQKFANEINGSSFKEIPFHMMRVRLDGGKTQITPTASSDNGAVRIKAGTGKERVSEAVGPIMTNFEKLFITNLEQTGRDYFLSGALKDINNTLSGAKKKIDPDKMPLLDTISGTLSEALGYEFDRTRTELILRSLLSARAATTLLNPIRTAMELGSTLASYPLRARTLSGYKDLFGKQKEMSKLLEFTNSPLRLRQNINNAIDINDGRIEPQSKLTKATAYLSGLPERTMMVTSWLPTFKSEFKDITGLDFDMKKFNDSSAYRERYGKAVKEASAVADAQTEKIIGPTTKAGQRREVRIAPKVLANIIGLEGTVPKNTAAGQILGFFSNYPYREVTEFVNGFKEAAEVIKDEGALSSLSQLQKPLGIALNVAAYGFLGSLAYAAQNILLGDEDDEERGNKILKDLLTTEGFLNELASNAISLAGSKYAAGGKALLQLAATIAIESTDDEKQKAKIKKLLKDSVFVDPLPVEQAAKFGGREKALSAIGMYIPQFVIFADRYADFMGGINEVGAIYDKVESKGIESLTKDEGLQVLALNTLFNASQIVLNIAGTSIPAYNYIKTYMNKLKEDAGVANVYKGEAPAKKKSSGGGGGRAKTMNKTDLKRYNPDLYNELYGEGSATYEIEQEIKAFEKEQREMKKRIKDQMYGGD